MPIAFAYYARRDVEFAIRNDAVSTIAAINMVANDSNSVKLLPYEVRRIQPGLFAVVCQVKEEDVPMIECIARRMHVLMDAPYAITDHPSSSSRLCLLTAEESMWQPCLESCAIPRNTAPGCWGTVSPFDTEELFGIVHIILETGSLIDSSPDGGNPYEQQAFAWFWETHNKVGYRNGTWLPMAMESVRDGAHRIIAATYPPAAASAAPASPASASPERVATPVAPAPPAPPAPPEPPVALLDADAVLAVAKRRAQPAPSDVSTPYAFKAAKTKVGDEVKLRALHDIGRLRQNFGDAVWGWRENLAGEPLQWNWNTRAAAGYAADAECGRSVSVA